MRCGATPPSSFVTVAGFGAVAANQAVPAQDPNVAELGNGLGRQFWRFIRVGQTRILVSGQSLQLPVGEPCERQINAKRG